MANIVTSIVTELLPEILPGWWSVHPDDAAQASEAQAGGTEAGADQPRTAGPHHGRAAET